VTLGWLLFAFDGRISRKAYWFAAAITVAIDLAASLLDRLLLGTPNSALSLAATLFALFTGIAVSAKRWHDRDKAAWWILIVLIPLIGPIWAIVENGFLRGTPGPNRFGPDPLA
jgi:uncharacterized membrane protein YhaH (DUF805 family)